MLLRKKVYGFMLLLFPYLLSAQTIQFDFESIEQLSDFNFKDNHWNTDSLFPISGNSSLHHCFDDSVSNSESIIYSHNMLCPDSALTTWSFYVRYAYNTSSGNNWSFWLANKIENGDLSPDGNSTGYLLGVNYTDSDDILKLLKKDANGISEIINTGFNWQENVDTENSAFLKIERTPEGYWNIYINNTEDSVITISGSGYEKSFAQLNAFGIYYKYTSTCDQKLWIDNINVSGNFFEDIYPPEIDSFKITSKNSLEIFFNEIIDTTKALNITYNSSNDCINYYWKSSNTLELYSNSDFIEDNLIIIENIFDKQGNKASLLKCNFSYYYSKLHDVLITEIMADPSPQNNLPECEYLEIYNAASHTISLKDWILTIGDNNVALPDITLESNCYYLITKSSNVSLFTELNNIIGITSMPAIINSGEIISLTAQSGNLIYAIEYSDDWFESEYKKEGGWSLELTNLNQGCPNAEFWSESKSSDGGTPGKENSVKNASEDLISPSIQNFFIQSPNIIELEFSESMDSTSIVDISNYQISGENEYSIISAITSLPFFNTVTLISDNNLSVKNIYELVLENEITDCPGNQIDKNAISLGVPELCDSSDILINEILFNADDNIPEFIELINNSKKIIDLKNFSFNYLDSYTDEINQSFTIISKNHQLLPGEYVAITQDYELLINAFPECDDLNIIEPESWKALNNEGGKIALINTNNKIVDIAVFNSDMHFALLENCAGVSLERIALYNSGDIISNWHSAASTCNYATPGKQNSQFMEQETSSSLITFSSDVLSPDNNGENDKLVIHYLFEKPGFLASIKVFNQNGEEVTTIANNELCETEGDFIWDGLSNEGNNLPMGYYIVFYKTIHPEGLVIKDKKCILLMPYKK